MSRLVGIKQAAEILGVSQGTLYNWRANCVGPRDAGYESKGAPGPRRIVYDVAELQSWLEGRLCPTCGKHRGADHRGSSDG